MIRSLIPVGAAALLGATGVLAAQATCSLTQKCPKEAPCCSQYGQCGVGAYCLGGCDPRMSFSLDSCMPAPVCQSKTYKMNSLDRVMDINKYLGDPSSADWVAQGEPVLYNNNVLLTMPANSVGTVLATTDYMWYGSVSAQLKTSRGAGVVTAFILLSDVKDEIDYEFVGTELDIAQTNYYFQGIPNYDNSGNISLSNTFDNFHTYEIKWTPDEITWLVDGQVGRTKKRSDTWNATSNQWAFPQTPARVQISIWPGGASTNAPGTIQWAGGPIKWDTEDIKNYGYYFATFGEIKVTCLGASSPPGTNKGKSYTYNNAAATNDTVIDGDKGTALKSFLGSGLDVEAGASASGTGSNPSETPNTVPGGSSMGQGSNGQAAGSDSGSSTSSAPKCDASGFTQNTAQCGGNKNEGARVGGERILGASAFAVVVALAGMLAL